MSLEGISDLGVLGGMVSFLSFIFVFPYSMHVGELNSLTLLGVMLFVNTNWSISLLYARTCNS
jgi:hypothetical protein